MKKTAILASAAMFFLTVAAQAQTTETPKDPASTQPTTQEPVVKKDKYNNWDSTTYKLQPMPEALTTEKIFPVLGKYQLTDKDGANSTVTVSLDETNKGTVWIDGLPDGKIKAYLRKSPSTYKIPEQKLGDDKDAKSVAEGVLIYDKDANTMNICIGCAYNNDNPAVAFEAPATPVVVDQPDVKTTKKSVAKSKTPVVPEVVETRYTGTKVVETTASVQTMQQ